MLIQGLRENVLATPLDDFAREALADLSPTWTKKKNVTLFNKHIYVPRGEIRNKVLRKHYNLVHVRHSGCDKMLKLIRWNYMWESDSEDVERYT